MCVCVCVCVCVWPYGEITSKLFLWEFFLGKHFFFIDVALSFLIPYCFVFCCFCFCFSMLSGKCTSGQRERTNGEVNH